MLSTSSSNKYVPLTEKWLWCRFSYLLTFTKNGFWFVLYTMHRKCGFPLRISLVNVPKSAVNYGFAYIYYKNC